MKKFIMIPSKGRAGKCVVFKRLLTQENITRLIASGFQVFLAVEPQDLKAYTDAYAHMSIEFYTLDENDKGIGYSRKQCQLFAAKHEALLIFLDDDTYQLRKRDGFTAGGYHKLVSADPVEVFSRLVSQVQIHGMTGLSPAQNNYLLKDGKCARLWNVVGMDAKKLVEKNVIFDAVAKLFEDFDLQASAMQAKFTCPMIIEYAFDTTERIGQREGGCQSFDRERLSMQMSDYMMNKWGENFVRLKVKKNNGYVEPQFKWKKLLCL